MIGYTFADLVSGNIVATKLVGGNFSWSDSGSISFEKFVLHGFGYLGCFCELLAMTMHYFLIKNISKLT